MTHSNFASREENQTPCQSRFPKATLCCVLKDMQGSSDAEDKSLMTALAVATGVGALFMVAALLVFWQRRRRARSFFYYRDNYGKVTDLGMMEVSVLCQIAHGNYIV